MSKKKQSPPRRAKETPQNKSVFRRLRGVFVAVTLLSTAAVGLAMYKQQYDVNHDLSVLGNGTPTVVQIHDPGCALCRQLRDNVKSVKGSFKGRIQFRIADITTSKGRGLANRYDVPHVTLLLFDGSGALQTTVRGVREPEALQRAFNTLL